MTNIARHANRDTAEKIGELHPDTAARSLSPSAPVVLATPAAAAGVAGATGVLGAAGVGYGIEEVLGD